MTKLLNEIDDKLESLEVFFRLNKSSIVSNKFKILSILLNRWIWTVWIALYLQALESREDAAANEDAEDEELSEHEDQSADEMEED